MSVPSIHRVRYTVLCGYQRSVNITGLRRRAYVVCWT